MACHELPPSLRIELVDRDHPGLPAFFATLPTSSGWPEDTVLSLTDREPTEFERADRYVAALHEEKVVGAISLHPGTPGNYHRMHNLHFHVDMLRPWQGHGIGHALMEELLVYARKRGVLRLWLGTLSSNRRALRLFARFGFRVEGVSRAAYRVKTVKGDSYFLDGVGMALWLGPRLMLDGEGRRRFALAAAEAAAGGGEGAVEYYTADTVTAGELAELYASVDDQRHRFPDALQGAWLESDLTVTAREGDRLVGLARAITDRHTTLYVCDILVRPDRQRRGIGTELMRRVVAPHERIYQIVLITDPETLPFYARLGYMQWESACLKMHRLEGPATG